MKDADKVVCLVAAVLLLSTLSSAPAKGGVAVGTEGTTNWLSRDARSCVALTGR